MARRITLGNLFHQLATDHPERLALTIAPSGEQRSYQELERQINSFAHGLNDASLVEHHYVGIMLENSVEYLVASYALEARLR